MHFVNNSVIPRNPPVATGLGPFKGRVNHHAFGHKRCTIPLVESQIVHRFHLVTENSGVPGQSTGVSASVGVEQQLMGIESVTNFRLIRAVDAVSINGCRSDLRQITVPNLIGVFRECDSLKLPFASLIEQTEFHFGRVSREESEIGALAVPRSTTRMWQTFLNHAFSSCLYHFSLSSTLGLVFFSTTFASVPSCYKRPSASGPSTTHRHSGWILWGLPAARSPTATSTTPASNAAQGAAVPGESSTFPFLFRLRTAEREPTGPFWSRKDVLRLKAATQIATS